MEEYHSIRTSCAVFQIFSALPLIPALAASLASHRCDLTVAYFTVAYTKYLSLLRSLSDIAAWDTSRDLMALTCPTWKHRNISTYRATLD